MFTKATVEDAFQDVLSVPHHVSVTTPYSFRIRPIGVAPDEPGYSVVVERTAFHMRARVVLDPLGRRIRSAILAGAASNPAAIERVGAVLRDAGWLPEIRIDENDLYVGANDLMVRQPDAPEAVESAALAAATLSEFVLSQLVITGRLELRPAAPREIVEPSEGVVWEYDPSERDRATVQHRLLENWLMEQVRQAGLDPLDPVSGPQFDVGWRLGESLVICEVKSTSGDETTQLRLGLGQVLHYRATAQHLVRGPVIAALLIEHEPMEPIWSDLCRELEVTLFWPTEEPLPARLTGA